MKLYYVPGVCSLAVHIVLREIGKPFTLDKVDRHTKISESGVDYKALNPKGYVPALELDDGQVLTEGAVINQFLADKFPEAHLAPAAGTMERWRLAEWMNYLATEIHKSYTPLFNPKLPDELKEINRGLLGAKFDFLSKQLEGHDYLFGDAFSIADAYLFTVLRWSHGVKMDLARWPALSAYFERIKARPAVQAALTAEGLN